MGYDIPLAQKAIQYEKINFVAKNDYYQNKKIEIEREYAQVGGNFIKIIDNDEPRSITCKDMKLLFKMYNYTELNVETNKKEKKYFFDTWTDDPTHRIYETMDFIPNPEKCPSTVYNLFTGFEAEKLAGKYDYDEKILEPILEHIDILTENNRDWFLQWLACKIQHPDRKTEVIPLLRDVEGFLELCGGTGKTCFIDWFGSSILGEKYYMSIHNNEDLYNSFNGFFEGKLLIHLEEAEGGSHHKNDNILKARTTGKKVLVNKKSINAYKVNDYADIIASTNNKNPMKVNLSNRRISPFDVSSSYRNDPIYFKRLRDTLANEQAIYSFFVYLRDHINVPPKFDIAKTAALTDMTLMNISPLYKWIIHLVKTTNINQLYATQSYEMYAEFCKNDREGKDIMSMTAFGLSMKGTDLIPNKRTNMGVLYIFKIDEIIAKLKQLNLLPSNWKKEETPDQIQMYIDETDESY